MLKTLLIIVFGVVIKNWLIQQINSRILGQKTYTSTSKTDVKWKSIIDLSAYNSVEQQKGNTQIPNQITSHFKTEEKNR